MVHSFMRRPLLITALIISSFTAQAKDGRIVVTGKISDTTNDALEFVTIRQKDASKMTVSGFNGKYSLTAEKKDTVDIVFSLIGYREVIRRLVNAPDTVRLNIVMRPADYTLQQVEITDFKKQTDTRTRIGKKDVRNVTSPSGNGVEDVITTMPGVSASNEMSPRYYVRGGNFDENAVYINGMEVYRPILVSSGQQEGMSIVNPSMVQSIDFSAGGFGAEYGDVMSSVLDVTYAMPDKLTGNIDISLSGINVSIGGNAGKFSNIHGFRFRRNSNLLASTDNKGEYDPHFIDYQTNMSLDLSKSTTLNLTGVVAVNDYQFTPVDRNTSFGTMVRPRNFKVYFDGREQDRFTTILGNLSLTHHFSSNNFIKGGIHGFSSREKIDYDITGMYRLEDSNVPIDTTETFYVGAYNTFANDRMSLSMISGAISGGIGLGANSLSGGVTVSRQLVSQTLEYYELADSVTADNDVTPEKMKTVYRTTGDTRFDATRIAVFIQDTYRANAESGLWVLNAGVRYSYFSFNRESIVSPRLSIAFVPEKARNVTLRLSTGIYYQSPFYKEFRFFATTPDNIGRLDLNRNIKSQRSAQIILGSDVVFKTFGRPFKFTAEAYYKHLDNLVPFEIDNLQVNYSGFNSNKGYAAGIDFRLFGQFVPGVDSWISVGLMKTDESTPEGKHMPRPTDRRYALSVFFNDYMPGYNRLKFSLKGVLYDGLPTVAPHSTRADRYFRTPAYKRVDAGISFGIVDNLHHPGRGMLSNLKGMWAGVELFNMFDMNNVSNYLWIGQTDGSSVAVPNYLTGRRLNLTLKIDF